MQSARAIGTNVISHHFPKMVCNSKTSMFYDVRVYTEIMARVKKRMDISALLTIAKYGCNDRMVKISSSRLASDIKTSQQTAARRIKEFEMEGYIERVIMPKGQMLRLTSKGMGILLQTYHDLARIFDSRNGGKRNTYVITGEVSSGMGEGTYYTGLPEYRRQFIDKFGFAPSPGTLNLKLKTEEDIKNRQALQHLNGIMIKGFTHENRTFGDVKGFRATIDGIKGAVIIPARTHHGSSTLEVIAPENIRDSINLKDGDVVTVRIYIDGEEDGHNR